LTISSIRRAPAVVGGETTIAARARKSGSRRTALLFLLPAFLVYTGVYVAPAIASVVLSLFRYSGTGDKPTYIGFRNFRDAVHDTAFRSSFENTFKVLFFVGIAVFVASFVLTMTMREMRARGFVRAVLFFPYLVSPVIIAIVWGFMLDPTRGLLNTTLRQAGLGDLTQVWLGPKLIFPMMMMGMGWMFTGFFVTILLAGVERIPPYYYESADLAGATRWQKFRLITLPLSWDVVGIMAVLWVINAMKTFEFIYAFTGVGTPPSATNWTAALYVYYTGFASSGQPELGRACAMAVIMLVIIAVLVLLIQRLMRRERIEF
jgi:raffinose/stachyose/melibiose transport system permease protein